MLLKQNACVIKLSSPHWRLNCYYVVAVAVAVLVDGGSGDGVHGFLFAPSALTKHRFSVYLC